ncbi:hypothetical protein TRAPUB_13550 [Trametes pubescens]|uniref:Uncharacterized protein n=1 Tax=Trametes pubescens TaxID=154538 RepID=A0A1M2VQT1_TRAPU|nr:hypothetical protein TRAPUB_13550 [Trametes pubescens]
MCLRAYGGHKLAEGVQTSIIFGNKDEDEGAAFGGTSNVPLASRFGVSYGHYGRS